MGRAQYQESCRKNPPSVPASSKRHRRDPCQQSNTMDRDNPSYLPFQDALVFRRICLSPPNKTRGGASMQKHSFHSRHIGGIAAKYLPGYVHDTSLHDVRLFHSEAEGLSLPIEYLDFLRDTFQLRSIEMDSIPSRSLPSDNVPPHSPLHQPDRSCDTMLRQIEGSLRQCEQLLQMKLPYVLPSSHCLGVTYKTKVVRSVHFSVKQLCFSQYTQSSMTASP